MRMNGLIITVAVLLAIPVLLAAYTLVGSRLIEWRNPPAGEFAEIDGTVLHFVHVPATAAADLPPVVFIHGASGNLRDQMIPIRPLLEGRAEMLFVDRPGHGWSRRGTGNETPDGQADRIAGLMAHLGIERAVVVGHSFGGGIAAAFALRHPRRLAGLVFLSAATHPWPDNTTSWYYKIAARPVLGRVFSHLLSLPGGQMRMPAATVCVFVPNPVPERYSDDAGIELVLRPGNFRANAIDVESLHDHVTAAAPRYREIAVPTVVISGDSDTVVYEEIHSQGLARDILGAELVWIGNLGHKPDWIAPDLVAAAIEKTAGRGVDLQALGRSVEQRIAGDAAGAEFGCGDPAPAAAPAGE